MHGRHHASAYPFGVSHPCLGEAWSETWRRVTPSLYSRLVYNVVGIRYSSLRVCLSVSICRRIPCVASKHELVMAQSIPGKTAIVTGAGSGTEAIPLSGHNSPLFRDQSGVCATAVKTWRQCGLCRPGTTTGGAGADRRIQVESRLSADGRDVLERPEPDVPDGSRHVRVA